MKPSTSVVHLRVGKISFEGGGADVPSHAAFAGQLSEALERRLNGDAIEHGGSIAAGIADQIVGHLDARSGASQPAYRQQSIRR